jgi:hypothetical protein
MVKNNKPPYLLGLLCLLPLLGAFVGIALILYGIFKYKDKKLIIIGSIGIVITIIFYSFLFYQTEYGKIGTKAFADISQTDLNDIAKDVEFYKIKYGVYPDSLEQLINVDKFILIDDPLRMRMMDDNVKTSFYYKKIGNKYTLFSLGIDDKANTQDDIYPNIFDSDTIKYGLIKSNKR